MSTSQKFILSFLLVILAGLVVLVARLGYNAYNRPLGPALLVDSPTPLGLPPTWTPTLLTQLPSSPTRFATGTIAPTITPPSGLCGAPSTMSILVVGTDARDDSYQYGLADVIRIVRVDFLTPKVSVLEFPRDLWVQIPDIADNLNGQDHEKLNQAYLYGNRGFGYTDDPAQGPGLLARTLRLNFGIKIDHYAAVNMLTFAKVVDAVGGIDLNLPHTVDGRTADSPGKHLLFLKGKHHLSGSRALMLARIRINGTFARADNQNRVLCALRDKLLTPKVVPQIPKLIESFQGAMQTDLSPAQLSQLACLGPQLGSDDILFASFPEKYFKATRIYDPVFKKNVFIWDVDFNVLRGFAIQFNDGSWPPPPAPTPIPIGTSEPESQAVPFCP